MQDDPTATATEIPTPTPNEATLEIQGSPEQVSALVTAIAAASEAFDTIGKSEVGQIGHQRFKYASLSTIMRAIRRPLADHGVVVLQPFHSSPDLKGHRITTLLMGHGATIRFFVDFVDAGETAGENDRGIKVLGKVVTYLRRYSVQSLLALEGDKDADDEPDSPTVGPRRGDREAPQSRPAPAAAPTPRPKAGPAAAPAAAVTPETRQELGVTLRAHGLTQIAKANDAAQRIVGCRVDELDEPAARKLIAALALKEDGP